MSEIAGKMLLFFGVSSLLGWIMLFTGISSRREQRRREEYERTRATGRIVDYVRRDRRGRYGNVTTYRPVIEFVADGDPVRKEYENAMIPEAHPVGEEVEVLYNISDPTRFHLESDQAFSEGAGNLARFGAIVIALAAVLTLVMAVFVGGLDLGQLGHHTRLVAQTGKIKIASDDTGVADDFEYRLDPDGGAVITGYGGADYSVSLPALLGGHMVTGISPGAFARNMDLATLTVPGFYGSIPPAAFFACVGLSDLTVQEGISSIGTKAFEACVALRSVKLPASLSDIANDAFPDGCEAVFEVPAGSKAERYCRERGYEVKLSK